jgi:guanyl-specific ribonuclease Sa
MSTNQVLSRSTMTAAPDSPPPPPLQTPSHPPPLDEDKEYLVISSPPEESTLFCNRWKCVYCDRTIYRQSRFLLRVDSRGEAAVASHSCREKEFDRIQKARKSGNALPAASEQGNSTKNRCNWVAFLAVLVVVLVAVSVTLGVLFGLDAKSNSSAAVSFTPHSSLSPSLAPTTSARPTISAAPSSSVVNEFLSGLPPYSKKLASTNASSPQAKALDWLQKDPLYNEYQNVYRLNQRYAMAVFYYSTNGDSWKNNSGWLSNASECEWYREYHVEGTEDDNSCVEASRLSFLDWDVDGLDGSLPTELELLTDLDYIHLLNGEFLSGTIHSEL